MNVRDVVTLPPDVQMDVRDLATIWGIGVAQRLSVRLPGVYRAELEAWIRRTGKTGCLSVGYSEGGLTWIGWEETHST